MNTKNVHILYLSMPYMHLRTYILMDKQYALNGIFLSFTYYRLAHIKIEVAAYNMHTHYEFFFTFLKKEIFFSYLKKCFFCA